MLYRPHKCLCASKQNQMLWNNHNKNDIFAGTAWRKMYSKFKGCLFGYVSVCVLFTACHVWQCMTMSNFDKSLGCQRNRNQHTHAHNTRGRHICIYFYSLSSAMATAVAAPSLSANGVFEYLCQRQAHVFKVFRRIINIIEVDRADLQKWEITELDSRVGSRRARVQCQQRQHRCRRITFTNSNGVRSVAPFGSTVHDEDDDDNNNLYK